jgi:hypothetical protein
MLCVNDRYLLRELCVTHQYIAWKYANFLNVRAHGTYSYHWALKGFSTLAFDFAESGKFMKVFFTLLFMYIRV